MTTPFSSYFCNLIEGKCTSEMISISKVVIVCDNAKSYNALAEEKSRGVAAFNSDLLVGSTHSDSRFVDYHFESRWETMCNRGDLSKALPSIPKRRRHSETSPVITYQQQRRTRGQPKASKTLSPQIRRSKSLDLQSLKSLPYKMENCIDQFQMKKTSDIVKEVVASTSMLPLPANVSPLPLYTSAVRGRPMLKVDRIREKCRNLKMIF